MSTVPLSSSSQPSYTCNCSSSALCTHSGKSMSSANIAPKAVNNNTNRKGFWSFLRDPLLLGDIIGTVTTIGAAALLGIPGFVAAGSGYVAGKLIQLRDENFRLKSEKNKQLAALKKIQSVWRGHLVRVEETNRGRKQLLSYSLLKKAMPYIDTQSLRENLPRASAGKTRVYLPKRLPIVLKHSGSPENQERFEQMREARKICVSNDYTHLVIPRARVYGNFIIESRLPIAKYDAKAQIGFYIEHREELTNAVKEFTGFLCQAELRDITGGTRDLYSTLFETDIMSRYDNVPLYLERGKGKIA